MSSEVISFSSVVAMGASARVVPAVFMFSLFWKPRMISRRVGSLASGSSSAGVVAVSISASPQPARDRAINPITHAENFFLFLIMILLLLVDYLLIVRKLFLLS
ncbi:hypothetical protein [Bacteroides cellulosilyticus]|uniref:hypothetical protein n=1 Tax=Bacteroides cellulosilyticus TaxID=246787 RepID=UPI001D01E0EE|nr:hypothetical protein [Bacteroides cellulosilyticus]